MGEDAACSRKRIYLLVGPKGAGKSFLGRLLERDHGIRFLRVEPWVKALAIRRNIDDPAYLQAVFERIEQGVREALSSLDVVAFETTGLTRACERMVQRLSGDFHLTSIAVSAPPELCLRRVRARDPATHIDVSDAEVSRINAAVLESCREADFRIDNAMATETELSTALGAIINRATPPPQR